MEKRGEILPFFPDQKSMQKHHQKCVLEGFLIFLRSNFSLFFIFFQENFKIEIFAIFIIFLISVFLNRLNFQSNFRNDKTDFRRTERLEQSETKINRTWFKSFRLFLKNVPEEITEENDITENRGLSVYIHSWSVACRGFWNVSSTIPLI